MLRNPPRIRLELLGPRLPPRSCPCRLARDSRRERVERVELPVLELRIPLAPRLSVVFRLKTAKKRSRKNRYKSPRKPRLTCSDLLDKGCQTALCVSSTRKVFFGGNAVVGRSLATLDENCSCKKRVAVTFALVLLA